jgi:very-short-patch-repair endonuclease
LKDGGVHRGSRAADGRRDEKLRRLGYRVIRLDAALVLRSVEGALALVQVALGAIVRAALVE